MSFLKKISILVLLVVASVITTTVFAQSVEPTKKLEPTDCFAPGLYKFQSVQVSVGPEKSSYNAGETVNFVGNVINENTYPVVDGNIFVRISKVNSNYLTDGHNAVDEMIAVSGISIDASSSLPVNFSWKTPNDLGVGDYRADYFFSVGKKFNLGGLPFTNEIIVGFSNFSVTGEKKTEFVLDRLATKVNNVKYNHIGNWPFIKKDSEIEIVQPIKNLSDKELNVSVSYELYFWDSLNKADKIDSKREVIIVPAKSSANLKYIIPKAEQSVYYLNIKATVGDTSSIVNIRTTSDIERARINYPAITNFPLVVGDTANLFSCFHTVYGVASSSKLILTLTDRNNEEVIKGEYEGTFGSSMSAASTKFIADKDYDFLNLNAKLFNGDGVLVDSYETKYDCSVLKSDKCEAVAGKLVNGKVNLYSIIFFLITLFGLFLLTKFVSNSVGKKIFIGVFILLSIALATLLILVNTVGIKKVGAETVSSDGKTKSQTVSVDFDAGWNSTYREQVFYGNISRTMTAVLNGATYLVPGDSFSFSLSQNASYNAYGGSFDTPYLGQRTDTNGGCGAYGATIKWSTIPLRHNALVSSNPSVISCSGLSCTAVGVGTSVITVPIISESTTFDGGVNKDAGLTYAGDWGGLGCWDRSRKYDNFRLWNGSSYDGGRSKTLNGYSPSWTLTVTDNSPIYPTCGSAAGVQSASMPISGLCSPGTPGDYNSFPTYWQWSCLGQNTGWAGGDKAWCTAPKPSAGPSCTDGIRNGTETGIDCGGPCPPCGSNPPDGDDNNPPNGNNPPAADGGDTNLNCSISMNPASENVFVNTNTTWVASSTPNCPTCVKTWRQIDSNNPAPGVIIPVTNNTSNILNRIFTTIGGKTISVSFSSSTKPSVSCVASSSVTTASTNVVQSGSVIEQ